MIKIFKLDCGFLLNFGPTLTGPVPTALHLSDIVYLIVEFTSKIKADPGIFIYFLVCLDSATVYSGI